jgi:hypothetical protein
MKEEMLTHFKHCKNLEELPPLISTNQLHVPSPLTKGSVASLKPHSCLDRKRPRYTQGHFLSPLPITITGIPRVRIQVLAILLPAMPSLSVSLLHLFVAVLKPFWAFLLALPLLAPSVVSSAVTYKSNASYISSTNHLRYQLSYPLS